MARRALLSAAARQAGRPIRASLPRAAARPPTPRRTVRDRHAGAVALGARDRSRDVAASNTAAAIAWAPFMPTSERMQAPPRRVTRALSLVALPFALGALGACASAAGPRVRS